MGDQNKVRFQVVQNIKVGENISIWGICPVGIAARDIKTGEEIHYDPGRDTADVIVKDEKKD